MESGATKTDCCLLDSGGKVRSRFRIPGINVATMDFEAVSRVARDAVSCLRSAFSGELPEGAIKEIFFYGAGVLEGQADGQKHFQTGENPDSVSGNDRISGACVPETLDSVLAEAFPGSGREYHSDLLAAARGLCGDRTGIVAILGTGSNSCLYDGKRSSGFGGDGPRILPGIPELPEGGNTCRAAPAGRNSGSIGGSVLRGGSGRACELVLSLLCGFDADYPCRDWSLDDSSAGTV